MNVYVELTSASRDGRERGERESEEEREKRISIIIRFSEDEQLGN